MRITRKLLIPTLIFISLIIAGLITYNTVVSVQKSNQVEYERLQDMGDVFQARLKSKEDLAVALASEVANNPEVQAAFAAKDRERLVELTLPSYQVLDAQFDIPQYQFHLPPATSFLRLHSLDKYGDDLSSFRFTVLTANAEKRTVSGPELGRGGLGVRGVVPVTYQGSHVGTVEFGIDIGSTLIEELKSDFGYDLQILLSRVPAEVATFEGATEESQGPTDELLLQSSTLNKPAFAPAINYNQALAGSASFEQISVDDLKYVVYTVPLYDYSGNIIGVVDIISDYTVIAQQQRTQIMLSIGILLFVLLISSFGFAYFAGRTLRPIGDLTSIASAIAAGDFNKRTNVKSDDELGVLAQAFDSMTVQLQDLFGTLEERVAVRTRNLVLAAEVGRTVSQVHALDVMLNKACDLILKEFNLYYVQVYLANASAATLKLEAGTGAVGVQLVGRGHSLPLDSNSLNGRAAIEKRAVVIADTANSATFRKNPLLPETRGEMAVPLIVADTVVGVLDMQSSLPGVLTEEILPAFEALAGQLAVAIRNATLLTETEQARAQVEAQARRLVREGWNEHLDAIHKPEHLGFVFTNNKVITLAETDETQLPRDEEAIRAPITVTGEPLGSLIVEIKDETQREQMSELVSVVARQVAQQIENLRLLESAERYRHEAEQAVHRQTRENWQEYFQAEMNDKVSFLYDLSEVRLQNDGFDAHEDAYVLPLKVRDETIGKLAIQGLGLDDNEAISLVNTVADRLTAHIEGLRQGIQTQSALAQSEVLFDASRNLTQATDLQQLVDTAVSTLKIATINRAILVAFNFDEADAIGSMDVIANWWNGTGQHVAAVGTHYPLEVVRVMPMFVSPIPLFFNDAFNDERIDGTTMQLVKRLNLRAVAVLPLHVGSGQIGALILQAEEPHNFTAEETRLSTAIAPQIATIVDNRRQFERAQHQADRESKLNIISQKIQSATTVEAVLQIAARELGHTLGAPLTIAQLGLKEEPNSN